ncbi:MAG: hypothetical protein M1561_08035 [Gammaproteobacteria bacterium]|nr:hypothetical protein [Gammaproteobacteria bacterium]
MPITVIVSEKIVFASVINRRVLQLYQDAVNASGLIAILNDREREAKRGVIEAAPIQEVPGAWASIKRSLGFTENTATQKLPMIMVNLDPIPYQLLVAYRHQLYLHMEMVINETQDLNTVASSGDFSCLMVAPEIKDQHVLIGVLLERIVTIALCNEFMTDRNVIADGDNMIRLMTTFVESLLKNANDLLVKRPLLRSDSLSSFGMFLYSGGHNIWVGWINSVVEQTKLIHAPNIYLSASLKALADLEKTISGYLLSFFDQLYYILYGRTFIEKREQLNVDMVQHSLMRLINIMRSKPEIAAALAAENDDKDSDNFPALPEPGTLLRPCLASASSSASGAAIQAFGDRKASGKDEDKKEVTICTFTFPEILVNLIYSLRAICTAYKGREGIERKLRQLDCVLTHLNKIIELAERLVLIETVIREFDNIITIGGWFPIILGMIRIDSLGEVIKKFVDSGNDFPSVYFEQIRGSNNIRYPAIVTTGLVMLPNPKRLFDELIKIGRGIRVLDHPEIIDKILMQFKRHFDSIMNIEARLRECKLLDSKQQLTAINSRSRGEAKLVSTPQERSLDAADAENPKEAKKDKVSPSLLGLFRHPSIAPAQFSPASSPMAQSSSALASSPPARALSSSAFSSAVSPVASSSAKSSAETKLPESLVKLYQEALEHFQATKNSARVEEKERNSKITCDQLLVIIPRLEREAGENKETRAEALAVLAQCCFNLKEYINALKYIKMSTELIDNREYMHVRVFYHVYCGEYQEAMDIASALARHNSCYSDLPSQISAQIKIAQARACNVESNSQGGDSDDAADAGDFAAMRP